MKGTCTIFPLQATGDWKNTTNFIPTLPERRPVTDCPPAPRLPRRPVRTPQRTRSAFRGYDLAHFFHPRAAHIGKIVPSAQHAVPGGAKMETPRPNATGASPIKRSFPYRASPGYHSSRIEFP